MCTSEKFPGPITAICVGHGTAVPHIRIVHEELRKMDLVKSIDLTDDSPKPRLSEHKHLRMLEGFEDYNPLLVLGLSEWSHLKYEENPGDSDAMYYAANGTCRPGRRRPLIVGTCIIVDSFERLESFLSLSDCPYEKREQVRLVAIHNCDKGHMGRKVYQDLIRQFPNLQPPCFLCFKAFDQKAARLVARRIRTLV